MKTRIVHEIGTEASLRVFWGDKDCPSCIGSGRPGYHNAQVPIARSEKLGDWDLGGKADDYPAERWPTRCDHCGATVPQDAPPRSYEGSGSNGGVTRHIHHRRVYDTASGDPQPGDIFEQPWYHEHFCQWDNCDGRHLVCVLPDGHEWQMTGRANNCGSPQDRTHRCWVLHEEAPGVFHVDKGGHTCSAGAGSIATPSWHGFLVHGELVQC